MKKRYGVKQGKAYEKLRSTQVSDNVRQAPTSTRERERIRQLEKRMPRRA